MVERQEFSCLRVEIDSCVQGLSIFTDSKKTNSSHSLPFFVPSFSIHVIGQKPRVSANMNRGLSI